MKAGLGPRVDRAETLIAAGDWRGGFEAYRVILQEEFLHAEMPSSTNILLIAGRFGDLASMLGKTGVALDVYSKVVADSAQEIRIPTLAKMLQLASSTGAPSASTIFRRLLQSLWGEVAAPPAPVKSFTLAGMGYLTEGMVCLGLGCFFNSVRRLPESGEWLLRGLQSFEPQADSRLGVIPLRLAITNHWVTIGNLEKAQAELLIAEEESNATAGGETYRMWIADAAIKIAITRGNLAEALLRSREIQVVAREKLLFGTLCRALLVRAEILILLNQLEYADACVEEAQTLPDAVWTIELKCERERVVRNRRLRGGLFKYMEPSPAAADIQDDVQETTRPQYVEPSTGPAEVIVWTGDTLRDYLLREAQVLETLDIAARSGKAQWKQRAMAALLDLENDFTSLPSQLIRARIHLTAGIMRQGTGGRGKADLEQARLLFAEMGARHGLWFANDHLIAAEIDLQKNLLDENDLLLDELAAGLRSDDRNSFELNKYRQSEWRSRARVDRIMQHRSACTTNKRTGRSWLARVWAKVEFLKALERFVWDLDEERLARRPVYQPRRRHSTWVRLVFRLFLRSPHNLTLGYLVLPDLTFLYRSGWGVLDCSVLAMGRSQIQSLTRELHAALAEDRKQFDREALSLCRDIGLQTIMESAPRRIRQLKIVTDDLTIVPFGALQFRQREGSRKYVVERFAVHVAEVSEEPRRLPVTPRFGTMNAFYMGGVASDPPLKRAMRSAENAAAWFLEHWGRNAAVTMDLEECLCALPRAEAFYYFGHGEFGASSDDTGLGFGGPNGKLILSARKLDAIDFSGLEQATIFACHSGDSSAVRGHWSAGLPQMLLRRGARSVLAAVWQADEGVAADLSDVFHGRSSIVGRAEALREFQARKIVSKGSQSDPIYWASFQIYGDGSVLRRPRRIRPWPRMRQD